MTAQPQSDQPKKILLALQGGAALGAFGWGVLDRLLEDRRLDVEGVSGTSSGAVNALLVAYGLIGNDRHAARAVLESFWKRISEESEKRRWEKLRSIPLLGSKLFQIRRKEVFLELMSRMLLPYQYDPSTMDPLRTVIGETVNFDVLRSSNAIQLFINATNIATNKNRVFSRDDVSLDAVCASCCLPFLFDAVEIDGEKYWDGAYLGNPTVYPLIYECSASDIILVFSSHLGPKSAPGTSPEISSRICQVSFTSALVRELRAIKFVTELIEKGYVYIACPPLFRVAADAVPASVLATYEESFRAPLSKELATRRKTLDDQLATLDREIEELTRIKERITGLERAASSGLIDISALTARHVEAGDVLQPSPRPEGVLPKTSNIDDLTAESATESSTAFSDVAEPSGTE